MRSKEGNEEYPPPKTNIAIGISIISGLKSLTKGPTRSSILEHLTKKIIRQERVGSPTAPKRSFRLNALISLPIFDKRCFLIIQLFWFIFVCNLSHSKSFCQVSTSWLPTCAGKARFLMYQDLRFFIIFGRVSPLVFQQTISI